MISPWPKWPIRIKVTVSFVAVLLGIVISFVAGTSVVMYWQLRSQLLRFAVSDIETVEGLLFVGPDGNVHLNEGYHNHPQSRLIPERLLEVLSPGGTVLYRNERLQGEFLGSSPFAGEGKGGYSPRRIRLQTGAAVLVVSRSHVLDGRPTVIRVGYREESIDLRVGEFLIAALIASPLSLAIAGGLAYQLAKRSLSPVQQMAERAGKITAEELGRRLPIVNPQDELGHLARVINDVLDRLQQSFDQLRRFTSDASHELRTPLAAIRSVGEVGLQSSRTISEYQETIGSMLEEVNRLTRMIDSLLIMSRAESGQIQPVADTFSLDRLVNEVIGMIEILAQEKNQTFVVELQQAISIHADPMLVRQAVLNVLDNAVRYSPHGGTILVRMRKRDKQAQITVSDNGPGIPMEHRTKIFERFYRIDPARTRDTGGTGLGLSIARWAMQVQRGDITVLPSDAGATFRISVPLDVAQTN